MANQWLRLWHDMPNDPKWRTIARAAKQSIGNVMAVYMHILVNASNATERGRTENVCSEDIASALDIEANDVDAIIQAMQGRVLDGALVRGWEKRQPAREDGAAERAKAWREQKKEVKNAGRTQPNAAERNGTLDKDKEEIREERTKTTSSPDDDVRKCPIGTLVDMYHELLPNNPRVKVINEFRKGAIRQRWREAAKLDCQPFGYDSKAAGLIAWRQFFEVCAISDFLTGLAPAQPGKPPFIADIDFIFSPSGFAKTLENKFHRKVT